VHTSAGYFQVLLYEMKSNKRFILDKLTSWYCIKNMFDIYG